MCEGIRQGLLHPIVYEDRTEEEKEATMTEQPKQQTLNEVLAARGSNYGTFMDNATHAQVLKDLIRTMPKYKALEMDQREALDNILQKIARMLNGKPEYADNWVDIAGYATLVVNRLQAEQKGG